MSIPFDFFHCWGGASCLYFHTQQQEGQAAGLSHLDLWKQHRTRRGGGSGEGGAAVYGGFFFFSPFSDFASTYFALIFKGYYNNDDGPTQGKSDKWVSLPPVDCISFSSTIFIFLHTLWLLIHEAKSIKQWTFEWGNVSPAGVLKLADFLHSFSKVYNTGLFSAPFKNVTTKNLTTV